MLDTNAIGSFLLHAGIVVAVFAALASLVGRHREDARLLIAGERAGYALTGMLICASLLLVNAFVTHDYANKYVWAYSDNNMPWYYLIAAFWGGQAGSLMFWSFMLAICTGIVIYQNREKNRDILPTVITVLVGMQAFFLMLMVIEANPFERFMINEPQVNGRGLEPLLQNPAMTFHPPSILSGYVWFTVPFAFAVAALIHRRRDDAWIRTTRRYAVVSWGFLSVGNLFGGMWAYEELGWGGFWGWDPVENAALMPWIVATAYLHSVMIQERRGLLRVWNFFLVLFTFFLTIFGTFLTRSGLIDSVHTFAQSDVGLYFVAILVALTIFSLMLLAWRTLDGTLRGGRDDAKIEDPAVQLFEGKQKWKGWGLAFLASISAIIMWPAMAFVRADGTMPMELFVVVLLCLFAWIIGPAVAVGMRWFLDAKYKITDGGGVDSLASREGVFLLNNLLLLGLTGVVMFGTIGEKISAFLWQETKYTAPWFNSWLVPGGLALVLLMGVGPMIPWRKMTRKSFMKNFLVPTCVATLGTAAIYFSNVYHLQTHIANTNIPFGEVPLGRLPLVAELTGVYALIGFWGVFFVVYSMSNEFLRGARVRSRSTGEGYFTSLLRLSIKQKRRYGGYLTHIGFAGLFLGFIGTGLKTEQDLVFNAIGEVKVLEDKQIEFLGYHTEENREYSEWFAKFAVYQIADDGTRGELIGEMWPSRRNYHGANVKMSRVTSEKDEIFLWRGNVYSTLIAMKPAFNQAEIMAHYNPMILHMWIGGAILLFGVVFSVWPESAPYPVFAAARRRRRRKAPEGAAQPAPLARGQVD